MGCESSKSAKKTSTAGLKVVKPPSESKGDGAAEKLPNCFKVVVVGDVDTGKTSLLMRFVNGTFSNEMNSDSVREKMGRFKKHHIFTLYNLVGKAIFCGWRFIEIGTVGHKRPGAIPNSVWNKNNNSLNMSDVAFI